MSDHDSKKKGSKGSPKDSLVSDGSRSYRQEPDIAPIFPTIEVPENTDVERLEPVFTLELEPSESSFSHSHIEVSKIQKELSLIQPQVDDFNKLPTGEDVTSDQAEVLRKYIALKESESRDLKEQQKQYQNYVRKMTAQMRSLTNKSHDLVSELETLKRRDESSRLEAREIEKRYREEIVRMKNEFEEAQRRTGNVSAEYQELQRRREEWKDKVREDLKRIKLKERELENKYELLKRDTQALLDSKDKHVIELKRKNDALELEMESLEERLRNATLSVSAVQAKKRRLIETLRLAISLLEQMDQVELPDDEKKAG